MTRPKVAIIVLNWNGLEDTLECLASLREIDYPAYEVLVVDNGSDGNDADVIRDKFKGYVTVLRNDRNYGCGGGYNSGMRYILSHSQPDYILLMNNDLVVDPAFLSEMVNFAELDKSVGIVGPKIYFYNHNNRRDVIWTVGGQTRPWMPKMHQMLGMYAEDTPQYEIAQPRDWVSGTIQLLRRSLIDEIGMVNSFYFFGHEDIEYCLKARRRGYTVLFVPSSKVWHKVSVSAKKLHITYLSPSTYYYFIKHNFPFYIYIYHLLWLPVVQAAWAAMYIFKYRDAMAFKRYLRDLFSFLMKKKGKGYIAAFDEGTVR